MTTPRSTPMLAQYERLKAENPDALLLFRLGDFYELFGEDAQTAAPLLDVQLTSRDGVIPMCGVPHHAVNQYVKKLIDRGLSVALAEQMEDPRLVKGLVDRQVIRVITPGTFVDEDASHPPRIASLVTTRTHWALAVIELSTGLVYVTEEEETVRAEILQEEWAKWRPEEYLTNWEKAPDYLDGRLVGGTHWFQAGERMEQELADLVGTATLAGWGLKQHPLAQKALYGAWRYVSRSQKRQLPHLSHIHWYERQNGMHIAFGTLKQLDITGDHPHTLEKTLDETVTAMGQRRLQEWLTRPLSDEAAIVRRHRVVCAFRDDPLLRQNWRDKLRQVGDIA
ncbi:MAG: DNA mismatch repair protein MutS, partial [Firmicutes bacterium]|nr:DNA mismatch repair protein MutS [Bacillota bacterium]